MKRLLAMSILSAGAFSAEAHDWYPRSCCSGSDCGPVISSARAERGLWATTRNGTVFVPDVFPWEPSPDGRMHVCVRRDFVDPSKFAVLCVFRGPGL
jgi:hypothetical protein